MPGILTANLAGRARAEPGRTALIHHGEPVSWADLHARSRRVASWLIRQGVRAGDVIGLTMRDPVANLASTYALMMIGCTQLSLYVNQKQWAALPKQYQTVLEQACSEAHVEMQGKYDVRNPAALKRLVGSGVQLLH